MMGDGCDRRRGWRSCSGGEGWVRLVQVVGFFWIWWDAVGMQDCWYLGILGYLGMIAPLGKEMAEMEAAHVSPHSDGPSTPPFLNPGEPWKRAGSRIVLGWRGPGALVQMAILHAPESKPLGNGHTGDERLGQPWTTNGPWWLPFPASRNVNMSNVWGSCLFSCGIILC